MNLLILSLLLAGVSSHINFHGVVQDDFLRRSSSFSCTAECAPGQKCVNGACQGIDMFQPIRYEFQNKHSLFRKECETNDDCEPYNRCWEGKCGGFCYKDSDCPKEMRCYEPICADLRPSNARCAAPCGPGKTCYDGFCVEDV